MLGRRSQGLSTTGLDFHARDKNAHAEGWNSHAGGVEVSCGRCGSLVREGVDVHGFPRIPRISMDCTDFRGFHGFLWISKDFQGFPRIPLIFCRFSMDFR